MTLYFCTWPERVSMLVDAGSERDARKIAIELGGEGPPESIRTIAPNAFAADVYVDDDDGRNEEGPLVVEPFDHVEDLLLALDAEDFEGDHGAVITGAPAPAESGPVEDAAGCASESEDESGDVYVCALPKGHGAKHEAWDDRGNVVARWES